jgi:PST family polysaccharide transporter
MADNKTSLGEEGSGRLLGSMRGGTRSVLVGQLGSQLVSLAALAVLYRLLEPGDFGLLGMAVPLVMIPRMLSTMGLAVATVQREQLEESQLTHIFWLGLKMGLVAAAATALMGWALAPVYGDPRLVELCSWLAGTSLLVALGLVHQALLERKMLLGRLVAIRVAGQLLGVVAAVVAAFDGWGVWSLVIQQYVEITVTSVLAWFVESWRPGAPGAGSPAEGLTRLGGSYSLSSMLFYLGQNLDKILIAVMFGSTELGRQALGMYSQAYQLMMKPVHLVSSPVTGVMLPALSRAWPDRRLHATMASGFYAFVATILLPAGIGLAIVAPDVMTVLGGEKWQQAGWLLSALAPVILVQGLINITGSLLVSAGKTRVLLFASLLITVLEAQAIGVAYLLGGQYLGETPWGQVRGIALGLSLVMVLVVFIPYMVFAFRTVGNQAGNMLRRLVFPLVASGVMGISVYGLSQVRFLQELSPLPRLLCLVASGVLVYGTMAHRRIRDVWGEVAGRGPQE